MHYFSNESNSFFFLTIFRYIKLFFFKKKTTKNDGSKRSVYLTERKKSFILYIKLFIHKYKQDAFSPITDEEPAQNRTQSVDLGPSADPNSPDYLKIEISDALNEKDKVKFTVKTKVKHFIDIYFAVSLKKNSKIPLHIYRLP